MTAKHLKTAILDTDLIYAYSRSLSIEVTPEKASSVILDKNTEIATNVKIDQIVQKSDTNDFYSVSLLVKLTHEKQCNIEIHYTGVFAIHKGYSAEDKTTAIHRIAPEKLLIYLNAFFHTALSLLGISPVTLSINNFNLEPIKHKSEPKKTSKKESNKPAKTQSPQE